MLVEDVIPPQKTDDRRFAGSDSFEEGCYLRVRCDSYPLPQDIKRFHLVAGENKNPPQIEVMIRYARFFLNRLTAETDPLLHLATLQGNTVTEIGKVPWLGVNLHRLFEMGECSKGIPFRELRRSPCKFPLTFHVRHVSLLSVRTPGTAIRPLNPFTMQKKSHRGNKLPSGFYHLPDGLDPPYGPQSPGL